MVKFPCQGCVYRVPGCHGVCKWYAEAKEKKDMENANRREYILKNMMCPQR